MSSIVPLSLVCLVFTITLQMANTATGKCRFFLTIASLMNVCLFVISLLCLRLSFLGGRLQKIRDQDILRKTTFYCRVEILAILQMTLMLTMESPSNRYNDTRMGSEAVCDLSRRSKRVHPSSAPQPRGGRILGPDLVAGDDAHWGRADQSTG